MTILKKQAKQDVHRDLSACFVLGDKENIVKGYYTLSANSIRREDFPDELKEKCLRTTWTCLQLCLGAWQ